MSTLVLYSLQVWWNCDPFSVFLSTCLRNEKLHIFCNSFMWFLDGCIILHTHTVGLFSFALIAVRRESNVCSGIICSPAVGPEIEQWWTSIMAVESLCLAGFLGEHTLAELCCGSSETLQCCFRPSSCSLIFTAVQSRLCVPAFCNPYRFQSSRQGIAAECWGRGKVLVPWSAGWDNFLAKLLSSS